MRVAASGGQGKLPWTPLLLALALGVASTAEAHDRSEQRRAIATVYDAGEGRIAVDVLLLRELPPGPRADALFARFDVDRSHDLSPLEAQLLANELGPSTVGGYVLRQGDGAPVPTRVQLSASESAAGGLVVAILLAYRIDACPSPCRLGVQLLPQPEQAAPPALPRPLTVELQVARPLQITASSAPPAADAPVVSALAFPGEAGPWIEIALPSPSAPGPATLLPR